jgi:hypothetical protein
MDPTEGSETSANINQTLGIHPKVETVNTEHSESLKSRINAKCRCEKRPVWRPRRRGKDNTDMDLGEIECRLIRLKTWSVSELL